jgi:hypothetical protein
VLLDGKPIAGRTLESLAQRVGYVFQDPDHQLFAATVAEEVAFGPTNLGLAPDEVAERVDEALAAVGLDARDEDPFLLDKGARQRLAVAAVLALRPDMLVLDEPTTGSTIASSSACSSSRPAPCGGADDRDRDAHAVDRRGARRARAAHGRGRLRYDGPVRRSSRIRALHAASFRAPDVTRLGQAFGCTPLAVGELVGWVRR